ncbi:MAG TPA: hypothetical protein VFC99_01170 [Acidimicrobiia bacterium]|nr:hypothetical protein [Acidimicrobiia bacterium]
MRRSRTVQVVPVLVVVLLTATVVAPPGAPAALAPVPGAWEQWRRVEGIVDVAGVRSDGRLVGAARGRLVLVSPAGKVSAFAPAYSVPPDPESYVTVSPGVAVAGAGCRFPRDEVLALDLTGTPPGITRVTAGGTVSRLATVSGVSTLSGITLDTVGRFGHRVLVVGPGEPGRTHVFAVDCRGKVAPVATLDAQLEGGIAVAPRGFGGFGGDLVAPSELSGNLYAVSPAGELQTVAASGVPSGGDIGVESAGFVPRGAGLAAYVADRGTPRSAEPHPGTDHILRLTKPALARAGVRAGDLLVATEGSATLVRVRCGHTCTAAAVATGPPAAHAEGHLVVAATG